MKKISMIVSGVAAFLLLTSTSWAQSSGKGVDKLYVLDCGQGHAPELPIWPGSQPCRPRAGPLSGTTGR